MKDDADCLQVDDEGCMKRKPGTLSLVSARGHELRETSSTPLWWKGFAGSKGQQGPPQALGWKSPGVRIDDDREKNSDGDEDDDDDLRNETFITISERDGFEPSEYKDEDADEDEDHLDPSHLFFGRSRDPATMASWSGQPSVKGKTETTRMMLLTSASLGIAFTWGVEMTYCTPYLLSLGLTKGQASMIWLAGPLSGLIVQPVIGVVSDQSTAKWGRRRPFMGVGAVIVAAGLLTLGFTKEIVTFLLGNDGTSALSSLGDGIVPPTPHRKLVICLAVMALYITDFAINAVMSCNRSLLVDTLPLEKQQEGAAWSSRMASLGHLVGYAAGAIDLVAMFGPAFGDTQFKKLSVVAVLSILTTCTITCWAVNERVLLKSALGGPGSATDGWVARLVKIFRQIWSTLLTLPPRIQAICWSVFWGWIGWFPFVVYSSTWVGETYFRYDVPADARESTDAVGDMGRIGSYALTAYSLMTVLASGILPLLVRSPYNDTFTRRPPASIARFVEMIDKSRPDLLTVWTCGHVMFACSMFMAPFAHSFRFATVLVTLCGIPWTVVTWAPTALLGVEVNKLTGGAGGGGIGSRRRDSSPEIPLTPVLATGGGNTRGDAAATTAVSTGELSGIYFGILNIYTTLPQLLGNLISAFVFAVLEPGKSPELAKDAHPSEHHSTDGPNAIAVTLFIGAVFALIGAFSTRRLARL